VFAGMHRFTDGRNPYNLLILPKYYSKNLTTMWLLTIDQIALIVVKYIVIKIIGKGCRSIYWVQVRVARRSL